ncbi:hypothetical protein FIBSPDRAFT_1041079 [Athelia psychrophila]|uniref:Mediator of RNA polymerase II transcription subunit 9 n=1 Tax=Athelia psychrophila TaxID=1759441 RepID=A0A166PE92_9AGAM|nr:hypothetical protein FIBSPDRAFT_1041079 [Fibularhizoctonia sp. CBS 109695]
MVSNALPATLYESLLAKLVTVLELTQNPEGTVTPQAKQALLHATNDFKNSLAQAKNHINALPGGELLVEEQDEVIEYLEGLKDIKRQQLSEFSARVMPSLTSMRPTTATIDTNMNMEIDSMASTPLN